MSTKIYNAYRLKRGYRLWDVVEDVKRQATESVQTRLRGVLEELMAGVKTDSEAYQKKLKLYEHDYVARLDLASEFLQEGYREQLGSFARSPFHLDVSIAVKEYRGRYYFQAFNDWGSFLAGSLDFLDQDPRFEDFHYQNSTDKPDAVSEREWAHRRKVWNAIMAKGWNSRQLNLDVLSWDNFIYLNPQLEMVREFHQKRKETV